MVINLVYYHYNLVYGDEINYGFWQYIFLNYQQKYTA